MTELRPPAPAVTSATEVHYSSAWSATSASALADHRGCGYTNPPQPRASAIELVRALTGCRKPVGEEPVAACDRAVAGARSRSAARLAPAPSLASDWA